MADGRIGNVTKHTWQDADASTRESLLFDTLETIYDQGESHHRRIKKLEAGRKADTGIAAGTGIIGGFLAMLGKELWK